MLTQHNPDLVVFGAGIFGLSVAFAALGRGASVHLVDPQGVAGGASGGVVGALAPHAPERWNEIKAFQFEALCAAGDFWADVAEIGGQDPGYARLGRLQPVGDGAALARALDRAQSARVHWAGAASWRVTCASDWPGWAPETATDQVIEDTLTARLHPKRACAALAAAIQARGGTIAAQSEGAAGATVWATGWEGLHALSQELGVEMGGGVKGQAALLACERAGSPQIYADGLHIVPHMDGTVAIGSTSERDVETAGTDGQLDAFIDRARNVCPALKTAPVVARWSGIRPRCRTRQPLLGPHPQRPGHFVANGGFKIGFGLAPLVGEIMADLILEGRDRRPQPFRIEDLAAR